MSNKVTFLFSMIYGDRTTTTERRVGDRLAAGIQLSLPLGI
ncbi:MAG: hypothetical protein RMY16_25255 [Nostoc sp. DedQUE12b]|nr:hypothetical protein [Nostoc sp. DedQUE12b]MDZ8088828.1 hypothetical protein [Nostoc sp. DedQUE12b]